MCDIALQLQPQNNKAAFRKKKCHAKLLNSTFQKHSISEFKLESKAVLKKLGIKPSPLYDVRIIPMDPNKYGFFATKTIAPGTIMFVLCPLCSGNSCHALTASRNRSCSEANRPFDA